MIAPDPLAEAARLVAQLRPDWQRTERFHEAKSEALEALRRAAAIRCQGCPTAGLEPRLIRAAALLRAATADRDRLRRRPPCPRGACCARWRRVAGGR